MNIVLDLMDSFRYYARLCLILLVLYLISRELIFTLLILRMGFLL